MAKKHLDKQSNQDYLSAFTKENRPKQKFTISNQLVREFVCQLPSEQLAIIYLKFWEGLEECEISQELRMSVKMVERILKMALDCLRKWMTSSSEPFSALAICA